MGRRKVNYFRQVSPIGSPKVVGSPEIGNFSTPTRSAHSRTPEALLTQERNPARPVAAFHRPPLSPPQPHHPRLGDTFSPAVPSPRSRRPRLADTTSSGRPCTTPSAAPPAGCASSGHRCHPTRPLTSCSTTLGRHPAPGRRRCPPRRR
jgi:hypothetical protein